MSIPSEEYLFLKQVERIRTKEPRTYIVKVIDLYNGGIDAIDQEVAMVGNILQVLELPEFCEVYIKFNQVTNEPIRLKKGIYSLTFFCFFLSYKHVEPSTFPFLLKLLIGKDIVTIEYPCLIEKNFSRLVDGEHFVIPTGTGGWTLPCKYALQKAPLINSFDVERYNQIKGIAYSDSPSLLPHYVYVANFFNSLNGVSNPYPYVTTIVIEQIGEVPFIIDLVAPYVLFQAERKATITWELRLYAMAWCK